MSQRFSQFKGRWPKAGSGRLRLGNRQTVDVVHTLCHPGDSAWITAHSEEILPFLSSGAPLRRISPLQGDWRPSNPQSPPVSAKPTL